MYLRRLHMCLCGLIILFILSLSLSLSSPKNMSAQTLSSSLVSQSTDKFEIGSIYQIASHEIELGNLIPPQEYLSGRIFVGDTTNHNNVATAANSATADPISDTPKAKRPKTGTGLFSKQQLANKTPPKRDDSALLNDPSLLVLNFNGIHAGEKVGTQAISASDRFRRAFRVFFVRIVHFLLSLFLLCLRR